MPARRALLERTPTRDHDTINRFRAVIVATLLAIWLPVSCRSPGVPAPVSVESERLAQAALEEGERLSEQRSYQAALEAYARAIEHDPECWRALVQRGWLLEHLGDVETGKAESLRGWQLMKTLERRTCRIDPQERRTTRSPRLDLIGDVQELTPYVRKPVRLHPRYRPDLPADVSKIGGQLLWPADEAWPLCDEHETPLVSMLQLRREDVHPFEFPQGKDLFQLLWCPRDHSLPVEHAWARPFAFWRTRSHVERALESPPSPTWAEPEYVALPGVLLPEAVAELPDPETLRTLLPLAATLHTRIRSWTEEHQAALGEWYRSQSDQDEGDNPEPGELLASFIRAELETAPGLKLGGFPRWLQSPEWPDCECGRRTGLLLQITSEAPDGRWLALEDRAHLVDGELPDEIRPCLSHPVGLDFDGSIYIFVCRHCEGWPIFVVYQA